jgi:hypothetical protein
VDKLEPPTYQQTYGDPPKKKKDENRTQDESVVVELLDLTGWSKVNDEETEKDLS